jgi:uncharacterized protein (TIGR03382 family)
MRRIAQAAGIATLAFAGAAHAGIFMSFADPIPGRQMRNAADAVAAGVGRLTYDQTAVFDFLVDGTDLGFGAVTLVNARMEMNMALGAAVTIGSVTTAPVHGFFTIYVVDQDDVRRDVITGTARDGAYVRVGNTNSLLFSDPDFHYSAGPVLEGLAGAPLVFGDPTEGVFTLTSIAPVGGGSFLNADGSFKTFDANASFTGNTEVIPAPGAIVLAGLGTLVLARRRRS